MVVSVSLFQEPPAGVQMKAVFGAIASLMVAMAGQALSADMPLKAPPVVTQTGDFYAWVGGSWQEMNLPEYGLGRRNLNPAFGDAGVGQQFTPRLDGGGGAAAIGYAVPYGVFGSAFGTKVRFELGGSYAQATGTSNALTPASAVTAVQLLNGTLFPTLACTPCFNGSTLSTDYTTWQVDLKAASDFKFGITTLTPSLAVFGGDTHDNQSLSQIFGFIGNSFPSYTASTSLRWNDWGAKFGLDAKFQTASWLSFGLGGSVGAADRRATLNGSDTCPGCTFVAGASSIGTGAAATPFLGNAEASLIVTPWRTVSFKAFGGLNYDSQVPGISSPSFSGAAPFFLPTVAGTPAGIRFASETSYYAGGLVKMNW